MTSERRGWTVATPGSGSASRTADTPGPLPAGDAADTPVAEGTYDLAAHRCFACGDLSASGLRMPIHVERDVAWSDLTLDPSFQGWEGITHGGIVAALLDEVMGWATISRDVLSFTARMSIEYRRPLLVGTPVHVEGRVTEARRRLLRTTASIVDPATGETYATAEGVYVAAPEATQREMRERYRFAGPTAGPEGTRRWRVRQSLPAAGGAPRSTIDRSDLDTPDAEGHPGAAPMPEARAVSDDVAPSPNARETRGATR